MSREWYGTGTILFSNMNFSDPDSTDAPLDERTRRTLLDPDDVTCAVTGPEGTTTFTYGVDPELTRLSQGKYRCDINLAVDGTYRWTWTGTTTTRAVVIYGEAEAY
jgi:hypothetical protein